MRNFVRPAFVRSGVTGIVMLTLIASAAAQYRSLPSPPQQPMLQPPPAPMLSPLPTPMLPPSPSPMTIPRPSPEIGAPPVLAVPEGEARQTERVCIEKEMCVDVPVSPKTSPSSGERK